MISSQTVLYIHYTNLIPQVHITSKVRNFNTSNSLPLLCLISYVFKPVYNNQNFKGCFVVLLPGFKTIESVFTIQLVLKIVR